MTVQRAAEAVQRASPRRRTEKVSDVIAREIVADIRGKPPMSMLPPETVMLEKYQVGRASLREALRILEVHGIVEIRPGPGGGPMVAAVDPSYFAWMSSLYLNLMEATYREVLEARIIMEPVMARLAAQRQDRNALELLEQHIMWEPPEDEAEYLLQTGGFHGLLAGLSGNRVLDLEGQALRDMYADRIEGTVFRPELRDGILRDHQAIARAIVSGNPNRAEKLMREHMEEYFAYSAAQNPGVLDEVVLWR
jgi:DNA-binding FadR family transcriptional regulator